MSVYFTSCHGPARASVEGAGASKGPRAAGLPKKAAGRRWGGVGHRAPLAESPPPPHTHTHTSFDFLSVRGCVSVELGVSVCLSLPPLIVRVYEGEGRLNSFVFGTFAYRVL